MADTSSLIDELLSEGVDAIIIEQEEKKLYMEITDDFKEMVQVVDTFSIDTVKKANKKSFLL